MIRLLLKSPNLVTIFPSTVRLKCKEFLFNAKYGISEPSFRAAKLFCSTTNTSGGSTETTGLDESEQLKILKLEMSLWYEQGKRACDPSKVSPDQWKHILSLKTTNSRRQFYAYLYVTDSNKQKKANKKEAKKEESKILKSVIQEKRERNDHIIYGLANASLTLRFRNTAINNWKNGRLALITQFAPKMVFDCSYDENMTQREAINAAKQLMLSFAINRNHPNPCDLHICNANFEANTMQFLQKFIPTLLEPKHPLHIHREDLLDVFPKEKLVYLTPHCRDDLYSFNPDDIYVVGGIVDKHQANQIPISLGKAKELGVRVARLPLDQYLKWGNGGGKCLTLDQMTAIMLELKMSGDWEKALSHVPKRKLVEKIKIAI